MLPFVLQLFCGKGTISQEGKSREEGSRNEKRNDQWLKIYKNLKIRKILQKKPFLRLEKPLVPYFFLKITKKYFILLYFKYKYLKYFFNFSLLVRFFFYKFAVLIENYL